MPQWQYSSIQAVAFDAFASLIHYPLKRLPYTTLAAYAPSNRVFKTMCLTRSLSLTILAPKLNVMAILPILLADLAAEKQAMVLYPEAPEVLTK